MSRYVSPSDDLRNKSIPIALNQKGYDEIMGRMSHKERAEFQRAAKQRGCTPVQLLNELIAEKSATEPKLMMTLVPVQDHITKGIYGVLCELKSVMGSLVTKGRNAAFPSGSESQEILDYMEGRLHLIEETILVIEGWQVSSKDPKLAPVLNVGMILGLSTAGEFLEWFLPMLKAEPGLNRGGGLVEYLERIYAVVKTIHADAEKYLKIER